MDTAIVVRTLNTVLIWDGWRAIAALGTTAAVWVALRRDGSSEKRAALKEAHMIGALVAQVEVVSSEIEAFRDAWNTRKSLAEFFSLPNSFEHFRVTKSILSQLKLADCPTIEVMTTVNVLRASMNYIDLSFEKATGEVISGGTIDKSEAGRIQDQKICFRRVY